MTIWDLSVFVYGQIPIQEYEQMQARIGAKVGKQMSKGRQQKEQRQATKGAKTG